MPEKAPSNRSAFSFLGSGLITTVFAFSIFLSHESRSQGITPELGDVEWATWHLSESEAWDLHEAFKGALDNDGYKRVTDSNGFKRVSKNLEETAVEPFLFVELEGGDYGFVRGWPVGVWLAEPGIGIGGLGPYFKFTNNPESASARWGKSEYYAFYILQPRMSISFSVDGKKYRRAISEFSGFTSFSLINMQQRSGNVIFPGEQLQFTDGVLRGHAKHKRPIAETGDARVSLTDLRISIYSSVVELLRLNPVGYRGRYGRGDAAVGDTFWRRATHMAPPFVLGLLVNKREIEELGVIRVVDSATILAGRLTSRSFRSPIVGVAFDSIGAEEMMHYFCARDAARKLKDADKDLDFKMALKRTRHQLCPRAWTTYARDK